MQSATQDAAPLRFNPASPEFRRNPYPFYDRLRLEAPGLRTLGMLVLTRHEDVEPFLKSRHLSVGAIPRTIASTADRLQAQDMSQVLEFIRGSVVFTDNPQHARLRRLIGQAYSAQALAGLETLVDAQVLALLQEAEQEVGQGPRGKVVEVDFAQQVAARLPLNVLCAWMEVPVQDRARIARQIHALRYLLDPGMLRREQLESARQALAELTDYFMRHACGTGVGRQGASLLALLQGARSGNDRLSTTEAAYACIMSFVAGNETTQCLVANTLAALHLFPAQMALLRADPALAAGAVEESIRFETPLQMTKRLALEDLEINGHAVAAGEQVLLCLGAANRDARRFDRPDEFDITRPDGGHVGFGHGMHACLGGALSRLQAVRLLEVFLARYESSQLLDEAGGCRTLNSLLRTWEHLHLRLHMRRDARETADSSNRPLSWT